MFLLYSLNVHSSASPPQLGFLKTESKELVLWNLTHSAQPLRQSEASASLIQGALPGYCSRWGQYLALSSYCLFHRHVACKNHGFKDASTQILEKVLGGQGVCPWEGRHEAVTVKPKWPWQSQEPSDARNVLYSCWERLQAVSKASEDRGPEGCNGTVTGVGLLARQGHISPHLAQVTDMELGHLIFTPGCFSLALLHFLSIFLFLYFAMGISILCHCTLRVFNFLFEIYWSSQLWVCLEWNIANPKRSNLQPDWYKLQNYFSELMRK